MCGRITLRHSNRAVTAFLRKAFAEVPPPGFNLGPGTDRLVVRRGSGTVGEREACYLRWGFVPAWTREEKPAEIINARVETVATKPSFQEAFRKRRCVVLADGFYEWRRQENMRQPYFFSLRDDQPFALAGIWEEWRREGRTVRGFCLLTTKANELMAPIHERMPVILNEGAADSWLEGSAGKDAPDILKPFPSERMASRSVSVYVNKISNEGSGCLEPPEKKEQLSLF